MMGLEYQILIAFLLDQLIGDPRRLPHPVKFIGGFAAANEGFCRKFISNQYLAGVLTVISVLLMTGITVIALLKLAFRIHPVLGETISILLLYTTIAAKDLTRHSLAVYKSLQENNISKARKKVGMIVGRDTDNLDEEGIIRATVESVAESMVDGVTAPLFFAMLGGPLGAMLYKAINTMDSMFGYKNERYEKFGRLAAGLDDLANFVPARLTALLMPPAAFFLHLDYKKTWTILRRDRLKHSSPNSGHPEAAVAGALNIQLGGTNYYFGKLVRKPAIGEPLWPATIKHILLVNRLMLVTSALALLCYGGIRQLALFLISATPL